MATIPRDNIRRDAIAGIHKAINKMIDNYLAGETSGTRDLKSVIRREDYDKYFSQQGKRTMKDAKREFLKPGNFTNLLKDIGNVNSHLFVSPLEYKNIVREELKEILRDRLSLEKDKKIGKVMENVEDIKSFDEIVENTSEIKSFDEMIENETQEEEIQSFESFYTTVENSIPIYEIKLPVVKIDEILSDVGPVANDILKKVLVTFFKTYAEYIDLTNKKSHTFKINDMSGDIMNNNRIVFNAVIFDDNDIGTIKNNVVKFAMGELYTSLPDELDVFGIQVKPMSFLDKEQLKETFEAAITGEMVIGIITNILNFKYEGHFNSFHIWSDKK